jgi:hypothetical protein
MNINLNNIIYFFNMGSTESQMKKIDFLQHYNQSIGIFTLNVIISQI